MRRAQSPVATPATRTQQPAESSRKPVVKSCGEPTSQDISMRAYEKWQAAGCPGGDGVDFWLEAEKELRQGR